MFSCCQELIAALGNFELLECVKNALCCSLSMIIAIMLFWSLGFANNFVISSISPTFVPIHKILLPIFLERKAGQ